MRALAFAFTFAFTFTSLARAETRAGYGGAAQGALASAPISLDPLSPSLGDQEVAALVFDTPFRIDATGQPRASLAISLDPPIVSSWGWLKLLTKLVSNLISGVKNFESHTASLLRGVPFSQVQSAYANGVCVSTGGTAGA